MKLDDMADLILESADVATLGDPAKRASLRTFVLFLLGDAAAQGVMSAKLDAARRIRSTGGKSGLKALGRLLEGEAAAIYNCQAGEWRKLERAVERTDANASPVPVAIAEPKP